MFCPKCRDEYVEGITECRECNIPLLDKLPDETMNDNIKLVTVFETSEIVLFTLVKSLFETAGLKYFVKGRQYMNVTGLPGSHTGFNPLSLITGNLELQVEESNVEKAKTVLNHLKDYNPQEIS